ncbi:hypothetical protein NP233_g6220 [Leucocoprinus birnbaumii]|uniref:Uncharacterized protein n=1 Tax=Leucocoprinus birnbaumii TaxID=56174 RepID=A0AAD5VRE5_9AGAR|nr:hypothetical protein NP233_g6220 [Leucocoprinus birnbaumii]
MILPLLFHSALLYASLANAQSAPQIPFLPLAVKGPYLNAWHHSGATAPAGDWPKFFTDDKILGWAGFVRVDNTSYQWMGDFYNSSKTVMTSITPTKTIYRIEAGPVQFNVSFFSPIEPQDYLRQSIPFSYFYIDGFSVNDSLLHTVQVYSDISGEWVSRSNSAVVEWDTVENDAFVYHHATRRDRSSLVDNNNFADDSTVYFAALKGTNSTWRTGSSGVDRQTFIDSGRLGNSKDTDFRSVDSRGWPGFAHAVDLGIVSQGSQPDRVVWAIGLTRDPLIRYPNLSRDHVGYWQSTYTSVDAMILSFLNDFDNALNRSLVFENSVMSPASAISTEYADILCLVTRQVFGSLDITLSRTADGSVNSSDVRVFMKDMGSSLRTNPVDVLYGALPALLFFNTTLIRDLLKPLLEQQTSFPYAAPDLGNTYPTITGNTNDTHSLSIDNTGSMLIMAYAHAKILGDTSLITSYYSTFQRWADFLVSTSFNFPSSTMTMDGIPGVGSTNLALKTIWGIYSMGKINEAVGSSDTKYLDQATTLSQNWAQSAVTDSHIKFNFDDPASWGLMYNIFPGILFNSSMISNEVLTLQANFYRGQSAGQIPLALRNSQTNIAYPHWNLLTAATIPENMSDVRNQIIKSVHDRIVDSSQKFPLPMRYDITTGEGAMGNSGSAIFGAAYEHGVLMRDDLVLLALMWNLDTPNSKSVLSQAQAVLNSNAKSTHVNVYNLLLQVEASHKCDIARGDQAMVVTTSNKMVRGRNQKGKGKSKERKPKETCSKCDRNHNAKYCVKPGGGMAGKTISESILAQKIDSLEKTKNGVEFSFNNKTYTVQEDSVAAAIEMPEPDSVSFLADSMCKADIIELANSTVETACNLNIIDDIAAITSRSSTKDFLLDSGINSSMVEAQGVGDILLRAIDGTCITLKDTLYVPKATVKLISIACLIDQLSGLICFTNKEAIFYDKHDTRISTGTPDSAHVTLPIPTLKTWHHCLGHTNVQAIHDMAKRELATGMKIDLSLAPPKCDSCILGKQTHKVVTSFHVQFIELMEALPCPVKLGKPVDIPSPPSPSPEPIPPEPIVEPEPPRPQPRQSARLAGNSPTNPSLFTDEQFITNAILTAEDVPLSPSAKSSKAAWKTRAKERRKMRLAIWSAMNSMPQDVAEAFYKIVLSVAIEETKNPNINIMYPNDPKTIDKALKRTDGDLWHASIQEELNSLKDCGVYILVPRSSVPNGQKVMTGKWVLLDIKTAYLYGILPEEEIQYMEQPAGFEEPGKEDWVWELHKGLYGMKQSRRVWNKTLNEALDGWDFQRLQSELCGFCSTNFLKKPVHATHSPMDPALKLRHPSMAEKLSTTDIKHLKSLPYCSLVGSMMYVVTGSCPDVCYAVSKLAQYLDCYWDVHWDAALQVARYLYTTKDLKLWLGGKNPTRLLGFSDSSYTDCPDTKSSMGYCFSLGSGVVSWSLKKQKTVSCSTTEAEYIAVGEMTRESIWLRIHLAERNNECKGTTIIFCGNNGAITLSKDPIHHARNKHIDM